MKKLLTMITASYAVFCLIFMYKDITEDIRIALTMWVHVLIPSLFPYLVLSQYITSSGIISNIPVLGKVIAKILSLSPAGVSVYLCSLMCGYPAGALCTAELWKQKSIGTSEAKRLITFTNNASPVFLICAIGGGMLKSLKDGLAIYIIQTASALIWGIMAARRAPRPMGITNISKSSANLIHCTERSINTMLAVGAYLVLAATAGKMITAWTENIIVKSSVYSFLEITTGIKLIVSRLDTPLMFPLICACTSWSGVAVIMQITSVIPREISTNKLISAKVMQSVTSFALGYIYKSHSMPAIYVNCQSSAVRISAIIGCVIFAIYIIRSIKADTVRIR